MKVGILTFHDGLNHGAYLQAYCTMMVLRDLGHDPVIINYKNHKHWKKENVQPWFCFRRPIRFLDHWRKIRAFKQDHKLLSLTPFTRDPDEVKKWHFDAVIFGSDTVWDTKIFGFDPLYFGEVNADRRIAYAASCGKTDAHGVFATEIERQLLRFDQISVRDENTQRMTGELTGTTPPLVLDPVFLPEDIHQLGSGSNSGSSGYPIPDVPYILIYGSQYSPQDARFIRKFAEDRGLRVIAVGNRNLWAHQSILSVGPLYIMNWFKAASFVFSSTFHGCIFAIRSQKDFAVRIHPAIRNKVNSLLAQLGLLNRGAVELSGLKNELDQPVDYSKVQAYLLPLQEFSRNWLKTALQNDEG